MPVLTKEQILGQNDLGTESVPVPEWGGDVLIRKLSGTERDAFEADQAQRQKQGGKRGSLHMQNLRARMVALCAVGEDGKRLFTDADAGALGKKSAAALDRVFDRCTKLNGFSKDDVDELEKNSDAAPSGASTSG